jgi:hypothetical protein
MRAVNRRTLAQQALVANGLTYRQLAQRTGRSEVTLRQMLRCGIPNRRIAIDIAHQMRCPVSYLHPCADRLNGRAIHGRVGTHTAPSRPAKSSHSPPAA